MHVLVYGIDDCTLIDLIDETVGERVIYSIFYFIAAIAFLYYWFKVIKRYQQIKD